MKLRILVIALVICFSAYSFPINAEEIGSPEQVIRSYFDDLNKKQLEKAISRWDKKTEKDLLDFIADRENQIQRLGLFNIEKASLVMWKELPFEYFQQFLPYHYMEKFKNIKVYYVGVDFEVYSQNEYFINGMNYFLIALVQEDGEWKIALSPHVPVRSIISDGYGFGTEDEKTYDERRLKYLN
ncbi:DUF4829 domain-containing protein [Sporosarcina highlanderae]|uniref:DUF4829 domain-containing protein n=1 Tax=Sporosarcina highlanderae TaxID=3035916 RepID=A0ABT8JUE7_9BACL|nr:DUF4829 domain-containing protein [Sporosarcina highlanderae]MDN4608689.1 DUF4829 domain-containing protein [Sporosarcina highlanderae]